MALTMLEATPVTTPVIFTLAGVKAGETATIERLPTEHATIQDAFAANEWRAVARTQKHYAAFENNARLEAMRSAHSGWDADFAWVRWPILNPDTRLALMGNPFTGEITARGYEGGAPATRTLILHEL